MPPHKLDDRELELANKALSGYIPRQILRDLEDRILEGRRSEASDTSWKEIIDELTPLTLLEFMWTAKSVIQELQKLSPRKLDEELLIGALLQLRDLEKTSPRGERKNLENALERMEGAKGALLRLSSNGDHSHRGTILALASSVARIKQLLKPWDKKEGKWGHSPQTRILVALMAYCQDRTRSLHDVELAKLASAAYKAAGGNKGCKAESLRKLWRRNPRLRKNWQSVLMGAHNKVHAPRLRGTPGIGPRQFKHPAPEMPESRVLGLQSPPKDVN